METHTENQNNSKFIRFLQIAGIIIPIVLSLISLFWNWKLSQPRLEIRRFEISTKEENLHSPIGLDWYVAGCDQVLLSYLGKTAAVNPQETMIIRLDKYLKRGDTIVQFELAAIHGNDTVTALHQVYLSGGPTPASRVIVQRSTPPSRTVPATVDQGCSSYTLAGRVTDMAGNGIGEVLVKVEGYPGSETTDELGYFKKEMCKIKDDPWLNVLFFPPEKYLLYSTLTDTIREEKQFRLKAKKL